MTAAVPRRLGRRAAIDTARLDLREDFWCACLMLVLDERAADGHELGRRLRGMGQLDDDPARVGHALWQLEVGGLIRAVGAASAGRAGQTYCLTCEGSERLGIVADDLRATLVVIGRFLARCGEHLELPPVPREVRTVGIDV